MPFFRGPITAKGTLSEGRRFWANLPPEQADALVQRGMRASAIIMNEYRKFFGAYNDVPERVTITPDMLYDSRVWSLNPRRLVPSAR